MKKKSVIFTIILLSLTIGFAAVNVILDIKSDIEIASSFNDLNVFFDSVVMDGEKKPDAISNNGHTFKITNNLDSDNKNHIINFNVINNSYEYDANITIECKPTSSDYTLTLDKETDIIEAQEVKPNNLSIKLVGNSSTQEITCNLKISGLGRTTRATEQNLCLVEEETQWTYDYTGSEQEFQPPCNGTYQIELWGAQAGGGKTAPSSSYVTSYPGNGGYTSGEIELNNSRTLYINVGGQGIKDSRAGTSSMSTFYWNAGGWNGGGGSYGLGVGTGGGATDVALISSVNTLNSKYTYVRSTESYASRIMVAGGGGAASQHELDKGSGVVTQYLGGAGGNLTGGRGYTTDGKNSLYGSTRGYIGYGGTQTAGGKTYNVSGQYVSGKTNYGEFGYGGSGYGRDFGAQYGWTSGGGGGYYGGSGTYGVQGAGGGSSFISGYEGCVAIKSKDDISPRTNTENEICTDGTTDIECSKHYSGLVFKNGIMKSGLESMPKHDNSNENMIGNTGNGYARIRLVQATYTGYKVSFDFDNGQTYAGYKVYGKNAEYGTLPTPEKDKYNFVGWYNEDDELITDTTAVPEKNHTLKAKWVLACELENGTIWDISYTGNEKDFDVPCDGIYKLEVWGAQGGSTSGYTGGYGAYSVGEIALKKDDKYYINVGGAGAGASSRGQSITGGYNGGGSVTGLSTVNHMTSSGGGATHIAKYSGLLKNLESYKGTLNEEKQIYETTDILIVAGGGGGGRWQPNYDASHGDGGSGGGFVGQSGEQLGSNQTIAHGGTQTAGGIYEFISGYSLEGHYEQGLRINFGGFGIGGSTIGQSAGGGGFFGGASAPSAGGGGSGYIANPNLKNKVMYCYGCNESTELETKTISTGVTVSGSAESGKAKSGNGAARITLIKSN